MLVYAVSVCLCVLAVLVVWLSRGAQRWLLSLLGLVLRLLLTAAILALTAAAVLPEPLLERLLGAEGRLGLVWLRPPVEWDFRLSGAGAALALAVCCLPLLVGLDVARAVAGHAAWLRRLNRRQPAVPRPRLVVPTNPEPRATPAARPEQRRSLDELLS